MATPASGCKRYVGTLNNYINDEITTLKLYCASSKCLKYVWGFEVGEQGTPHVQAFFSLKSRTRMETLNKCLGNRWRLQKANGNDESQVLYCTKELHFEISSELSKHIPLNVSNRMLMLEEYSLTVWKDWQKTILDSLQRSPDARTISWYWETSGNVGKSFLVKYIALTYTSVIISAGKASDVYHQVATMMNPKKGKGRNPTIVLMDVPRQSLKYVNYAMIENLKNGLIASGKYESSQYIFPIPHVYVFANTKPELEMMSEDRWAIEEISDVVPEDEWAANV